MTDDHALAERDGVKAHIALDGDVVAAGHALAYRVVNDGSRSIGCGAGSVVQRRDPDGWTTVSPSSTSCDVADPGAW